MIFVNKSDIFKIIFVLKLRVLSIELASYKIGTNKNESK